ncbi:MAG TPA: ATP-binding protein [Nodosilinea sp.]|nr:ATP-binding protein [Nodosilinea sp.]
MQDHIELPQASQPGEVNRLAVVLEHIAEAFLELDRVGTIVYVNRRAEALLGQPREVLLGKDLPTACPDPLGGLLSTRCHEALAHQAQIEFTIVDWPQQPAVAVRLCPGLSGVMVYLQVEAHARGDRNRRQLALHQGEAQLSSIFEIIPDGIAILNRAGRFVAANAAAEQILRLTQSNLADRTYNDRTWSISTVDGQPFPEEALPFVRVMQTGQPVYGVEHAITHSDGTRTVLAVNASPLLDGEGQVTHVVAALCDITDRKQAEEEYRQRLQAQSAHAIAAAKQDQAAFLADVSAALASSLEYEQTLQRAADLAVPYFADWCSIDLLNPDNSISRVAIAHRNPAKVEQAWELTSRFPRRLDQGFGISQVIQTGQPLVMPEITDEMLATAIPDPDYLETVRQYDLKSCIIAPLHARDRVLGSISLVFTESNRHYVPSDLVLATDLAQRVAIAIDNARLFQAAQQTRQLAEAAADRTARLQTVTAALSEVLSPDQLAEVILEQSMAALSADAAMVALVTPDQKHLEIVKAKGYDIGADILASWKQFPIDTPAPLAEAVCTGQPVWLGSPAERAQRYPHLAEYYNRYDFGAWLSLPLEAEGRSVGGISLSFRALRQFNQADRDFILALSRQCAQAILRAQLYEAERLARTDAERANRVKDEFLAILSHELRSPLNPILGWSQLLQTHKLSDTQIQDALRTIERNAKLQTQLIDDLLDIAKILRGKLHLDNSPADLTLAIEAALETVKTAALAKSIVLNPVLADVGEVYGDGGRLQQIVWNLLSNAIKFTPTGGLVEVRLERVDHQAQIVVKDTGKGIHPDFLPYLFESFRQEDVSITRQHGGLGLGLAIVRHLVEAHGGTIAADSPGEGQGATFTVRLPLAKVTPKSPPTGVALPSRLDLTGVRVLTVDDDPDARELLAVMLTQYGAAVTAAASVAEALAVLETYRPDVLISDIGMPDMDGYTFIKQVRALPAEQGGRVPAIALTAYTRKADQQQALASGFQRHLSKPLEVEPLVKAVLALALAE